MNALRWLLVLPVALLLSLGTGIVFGLIMEVVFRVPLPRANELMREFNLIAAPFAFIAGGAWVAPVHKTETSRYLVALVGMVVAFSTYAQGNKWSLVSLILQLASMTAGLYLADHLDRTQARNLEGLK